jgi:hypothetical protein
MISVRQTNTLGKTLKEHVMKKLGTLFAVILVVASLVTMIQGTTAWAADYQVQHTFKAPDDGTTQHNQSVQSNWLAPNVWQTSTTYTPPAPGMEVTREVERYSRTVRHNGRMDYAYCSPATSNSTDSYTDSVVEDRDKTTYKKVGTKVVGTNSGAIEPLIPGAAKQFARGAGESLAPWGSVTKITNAVTTTATATGGEGGKGGKGGKGGSAWQQQGQKQGQDQAMAQTQAQD